MFINSLPQTDYKDNSSAEKIKSVMLSMMQPQDNDGDKIIYLRRSRPSNLCQEVVLSFSGGEWVTWVFDKEFNVYDQGVYRGNNKFAALDDYLTRD